MKLEKDTKISHYKILSEIGKGGMGEVYLAQDTKLNRKVAIKFLSDEFSQDPDKLNRFIQEAQAASALNHPNILTVYEIGEADENQYIATEYIDGKSLNDILQNESLDIDSVLEIAIQIASALDEAHFAGIVHRDIKPDNVMVRENGLVKILDFGIAKLTEERQGDAETLRAGEEDETLISNTPKTLPGMIIGTANYMSPEQAKGKVIDVRTDIFSFGVVLYEMVSGYLPFAGETAMETIGAIIHKEPKPLKDIHSDLEEIIFKTLKKNRNERYQDSKELLEDLQDLKKRIEFEAELERTSSPEKNREAKTQILNADATEAKMAIDTASNRNSIAVMPFEHLSSDEDNEYFCDGLAEELINALAKVERLEVAARSSSFSFKGKNANISEISEKLNVRNILEGSVRKAGNRLRISVQLVNATDGYQIWSERYDREMEDIFDVQDEIALAVVEALKVKLLGGEKEAVLKKYTSNAEAYQLYLNGRFFFAKRTPEGFYKAIDYYKRAIEIDSEYTLAYSGLANCYLYLVYYEVISPKDGEEKAKHFAKKALELDDSIAESIISNALCKLFDRKFTEADKQYDEAIRINPKHADAYHFKAINLVYMRRFDEAIENGKKAIELEPFTAIYQASLGWWYLLDRRFEEALVQLKKAQEIDPNHPLTTLILGQAYVENGCFEEASSTLEHLREITSDSAYAEAEIAQTYGRIGQPEKARKIFSKLEVRSKMNYFPHLDFAKAYDGVGNTEKFLEYFEKSNEEKSLRLLFYLVDPYFIDKYGSNLRFQNILKSVGIFNDKKQKDTDDKTEAKTVMLKQETADVTEQKETASTDEKDVSEDKPKSKRNWFIAGFLGLIVLIGGYFAFFSSSENEPIDSIAVMPFAGVKEGSDSQYLSDGLTESIIYNLSKVPQLKVLPTSTVFRYKGKEMTAEAVGNELGVRAVLFSRITQNDDNLSISTELIDTSQGKLIWGERFERKLTDALVIQKEISKEISENLSLKLSGEQEKEIAKDYTVNAEAYQEYLKGKFQFEKRTPESIKKSIEHFEKAVELDPTYALGLSSLSNAYLVLPQYIGSSIDDVLPKARNLAEKSIKIDDSFAEGHITLALVAASEWKLAEATKAFKKAIALDPKNSTAHHWYALILLQLGQNDEALKEIEAAHKLEPLSLIINRNLGVAYLFNRDYKEAEKQIRKTLELDSRFAETRHYLAISLAYQGKHSEAIKEAKKAVEIKNNSLARTSLAKVYALAGKKDEAKKILSGEVNKNGVNIVSLAEVYSLLGEKDKAFEIIEEAYKQKVFRLLFIKATPEFDNLRDDSQYKDLLKRMGLPE